MSFRAIDTVLTSQALIVGRVVDVLTNRAPTQQPSISLLLVRPPGRPPQTLPLTARVFPDGQFVFAGDPHRALARPTGGATLDLRLVATCPGYRSGRLDVALTAADLTITEDVRTLGGKIVALPAIPAPAERVVSLTPLPIHLEGRVVQVDDRNLAIPGAEVTLPNDAGVRLAGRLHRDVGAVPVAIQDEVEGDEIRLFHDLRAGESSLPPGTNPLPAGLLRLRSDPGRSEYVTIAGAGGLNFREPGLLFDHPRATTRVHRVTLTDQAGEPADGRAVATGAPAGTEVVPLTTASGLTTDATICFGAGDERECHRIADPQPWGPIASDGDGFFSLHDVPVQTTLTVEVTHPDFDTLTTTFALDYRQPVNRQVLALDA